MKYNQHMKEYVESNPTLVKMKPTSKDDVFVLKYSKKVFFKNLWTPELLECRGTVIDGDYNIISRPFTKIFNRGERNTDIPRDRMVVAVEKINGFMACATMHEGDLLVSTTGTIDSDFANIARKHLEPFNYMFYRSPSLSFIFEIVDESDPHIIPDRVGAYLLGARDKEWNSLQHTILENHLDDLANEYNINRPKWKVSRFSDVVEEVKTVKHEGFVCYTPSEEYELKMKSPYYLATKFLGRIRSERFLKLTQNPDNIKKIIDEEFYPIIDYIIKNESTMTSFLLLDEQARMEFVRTYFNNNVL